MKGDQTLITGHRTTVDIHRVSTYKRKMNSLEFSNTQTILYIILMESAFLSLFMFHIIFILSNHIQFCCSVSQNITF